MRSRMHGLPLRGVPLTYFEFGTLAALWLFARARPRRADSRSGAGRPPRRGQHRRRGRRRIDQRRHRPRRLPRADARGHRPREGGHLSRAAPGACAPTRIRRQAWSRRRATIGARLLVLGRDYGYVDERTQWRYRGPARRALRPAVAGVARRVPARQRGDRARGRSICLHDRLPVSAQAVREGLLTVALPGRFQVLPGRPDDVLDVAHNPHAARALADALGAMGYHPETIAVCAMLADKDMARRRRRRCGRASTAGSSRVAGPRGGERASGCATRCSRAGVPSRRDPHVRRRRAARMPRSAGRGGRG